MLLLDRDPKMMVLLIQYLRSGFKSLNFDKYHERKMFNDELLYWQFADHIIDSKVV